MTIRSLIVLSAVVLGCVPHRPVDPARVSAAREWQHTVSAVQTAVAGGRFADADQALVTFAQHHPGAREAREVSYWRALFLLDPANHDQDTRHAISELDAYLADGGSVPHRAEAQTLRRVALALDSLSRTPTLVASLVDTLVKPSPAALAHTQDLAKENQKLKAELDKTKQELDRIKKRLAAPKPDGR